MATPGGKFSTLNGKRMGTKLYMHNLEEIIYESGRIQHHFDNAGIGEFEFTYDYKKFGGWFKEIVLDNFRINFGSGSFLEKTTVFFESDQESVEMHFTINGNSSTFMEGLEGSFCTQPNSHNIYYASDYRGRLEWNSKEMFFLEINLKPTFFEQYLPASGQFDLFKKMIQNKNPSSISKHNHPITKEMFSILNEIINCKLKNEFRKLFLEFKVMQLLLLQLNQLQQCEHCFIHADTSKKMIDKMYAARDIIIGKLDTPLSLAALAKMVNTNECTLKKEFKNVFGTTVFGFIQGKRMSKAKDLLLDNNLTINEISGLVGYKNAQHFSTAFKKQYGISPSTARK